MSPDGSANLGDETEGAIHISNAGLILTSPFLPHLFLTLGMVGDDDNGRCVWRSKQDSMRAVHILQYLTDERTSAPEPQLVLNKVFVGKRPSNPPVIAGGLVLKSVHEREGTGSRAPAAQPHGS